jgi:putative ABC transport system permease protein
MKHTYETGGWVSLVTVSWRNIWRNRRRTVLCVVAVGIAVFFNIFMQSWIDGMMNGIEEVVRTYETGHVSAVSARFEAEREYYPVQYPLADGRSASLLAADIMKLPGVKGVLPRITAYATLFDSTVKHALLWGVDIKREQELNILNLTMRSNGLEEGRYPVPGKNECAIGIAMAEKSGLGIGDSIPLKTVSSEFSDKYWSPEITGIFKFDYQSYDEDVILVPIDRLQKILGLEAGTQQLVIYAEDDRKSSQIRNAVAEILGDGTVVREWTENYWVAMMRQMTGVYVIVFLVFQIVASFLIINTMLMVIHERIKEIGMMGALGMKRAEIVSVFFIEAVFLSVLGSVAGCLVAGVLTWLGSLYPIDMMAFTGGGMKELPMAGTMFLAFSVPNIVKGFIFGVCVSALCTLLPSLKSAFIEPVEALRR